MKTKTIILTLALGSALVGFGGCKKQDAAENDMTATNAAAPTMVDETKQAATNVAAETKAVAVEAADKTKEVAGEVADKAKDAGAAVKDGVEKTVSDMKDTNQPASDTTAAQSLIDKAKAQVADSKYSDALSTLQGLANFKLTDDQQKTVNDLKEQIQKAMSGAGVSSLLGK